jgi:hypothetical protein
MHKREQHLSREAAAMTRAGTTVPSRTPRRVLAVDWFDGAKSGLAEYYDSANVLQFQLVSVETSEPWVFILRTSPLEYLSELDEILKPLGDVRLPVWAPVWRFESDIEKKRAESALNAAMPRSSPVIAVVVARRIEELPIVARTVATQGERQTVERMEREMVDVSEWIRFCETSTAGDTKATP